MMQNDTVDLAKVGAGATGVVVILAARERVVNVRGNSCQILIARCCVVDLTGVSAGISLVS